MSGSAADRRSAIMARLRHTLGPFLDRHPHLRRARERMRSAFMSKMGKIRAHSDPSSFPIYILDQAESAACFFSAAYLGRNAEIFVADAGLADVLLVDIDGDRLSEMAAIYPKQWRTQTADAFATVELLATENRSFDVVIVDPYTGLMQRILFDLRPWMAISGLWLVIGTSAPLLAEIGCQPTSHSLTRWLTEAQPDVAAICAVTEVIFRDDFMGGIYWIVMRRVAAVELNSPGAVSIE